MRTALLLLLIFVQVSLMAQVLPLKEVVSQAEDSQKRFSREKVYVHLDKPAYTSGDTIWMKAYVLDATFLTAAKQSGLLYLELANDTGKVVERRMMSILEGLGSGSIAITEKDIPSGSYTLRAYTNLMRNLGNDAVFKRDIYISSLAESTFLVDAESKLVRLGDKDSLQVGLRFSRLNQQSAGLKEFQLRVTDGKRVYLRDEVQTSAEGKMDVNFTLPAGADPSKITLLATDQTKGEKKTELRIPLSVSRIENADLQFMPESGHLIAGLPVRVAFKAIGEDGRGFDVSGSVFNRSLQKVAEFTSSHKGMGFFELQPQPGEIYTAKIAGSEKVWNLPEVKASGSAMRIINKPGSDSLDVILTFTPGMTGSSPFYLMGQYGSVVCYAGLILENTRIKISKSSFPTGVAHFTLQNSERRTLNDRIVFINKNDGLKITVKGDRPVYGVRDSVSLDIEVRDKEDKPVYGSFSIAVTDDSQVRAQDSLSFNINTDILLSSELKGTIEEPGYYFTGKSKAHEDLDNLLLSQGWIGHDWLANQVLEYEAEPEFVVRGKVINVSKKPLTGTGIRLLSRKPFFFRDGVTDSLGVFRFEEFPLMDTAVFRLQAKNLRGKNFNVGIEMNEFTAPKFAANRYSITPWYVNSDTLLLNQIRSQVAEEKAILNLPEGAKMLEEVRVSAKKIIPGSKNLNGSGISDFAMTENDIIKGGRKSLLQLIEEKVPNFFVKTFRNPPERALHRFYTINGAKTKIVIDGVFLDVLYVPSYCGGSTTMDEAPELCPDDYLNFQKGFLEYMDAEDIKGIEVMYHGKNGYRYSAEFPQDNTKLASVSGIRGQQMAIKLPTIPAWSWIEITTKSGAGPFFRSEPGSYVYRPPAFVSNKTFYAPKYAVKDNITLPDLRSTIHWEPFVTTDENGKAKVSFYSADRAGNYTINIQGADMDGRVGNGVGKIVVR